MTESTQLAGAPAWEVYGRAKRLRARARICRRGSRQISGTSRLDPTRWMEEHQRSGTTYETPPRSPNTDDCSNFCSTVAHDADIDTPAHDSRSMITSGDFAFVPTGEERKGDYMWQPRNNHLQGHVGVFTGDNDAQGRPLGIQMGVKGGASIQPWGPNGVFAGGSSLVYLRPLVPVQP